ncbi:MAG: class I SAM-dependent methyltransferase [Flavobacteriales bacterium]|nr:class I SAM-dependent methyltransferase [Flavobacteriales bacterium]
MSILNTREEILFLLRGFFATPIITVLGKSGVIDQMLKGEFRLQDIKSVENVEIFEYTIKYLVQIGLLRSGRKSEYYEMTILGEKILSRYGSFVLLHSYRSFMDNLDSMLFDKNSQIPKCDRLENVIGSGLTNGRKFFPEAIKMLDCIELGTIVDIGCGDGYFLSKVIEKFPEVDVVASDLSEIAINQTVLNLNAIDNSLNITTILGDAYDVKKWSAELLNKNTNIKEEIVISIWYVVHEVSQGKPERIIEFFKEIYKFLPKAQLIIGEITRINDKLLSRNRYHSLMPEFQFFHDISKQGVLSWEEYQLILKNIPYSLKAEKLFDPILDDVKVIPTGFIWHLSPK